MAHGTDTAVGDDQTQDAPTAGGGDDPQPSPQGDDGGAVEIHKPKPWHGWREFLKEYAIIVLGILTALGGEQLVETLHRTHEAKATEATLRQEVGASLINAAERVMDTNCMKVRLVGLSQALNQGGEWRANPLPPARQHVGAQSFGLPQVYRGPLRAWNSNTWQAVSASGSAAHMDEAQLRVYGDYYREIEGLRAAQERENALMPAVEPLAYDQALSADKRVEMQATLAQLDLANFELTLLGSQFIERARRNGLAPDATKLEAQFQASSSALGNCVHRLGSTADALPPEVR